MSAASAGLASSYVVNERPPAINVRYFYASQLALDDPLSPVPAPATASSASRVPPRPLSQPDNEAVDKAWNRLRANIKKYHEELEKRAKQRLKDATPQSSPRLPPRGGSRAGSSSRDPSGSKRSSRVLDDVKRDLGAGASSPSQRRGTTSSLEARHVAYADDHGLSSSPKTMGKVESNFDIGESVQGTTGTPFVRVPKRTRSQRGQHKDNTDSPSSDSRRPSMSRQDSMTSDSTQAVSTQLAAPTDKIPVGVSRLHEVTLPTLRLQPIYWSPVNDIANVIRGTWFYKDTLLPVETDIANLLEAGYIKLRPWTRTWADELSSAANAGPLGEEKIAHPLWPKAPEAAPGSRPGTAMSGSVKETQDTPEVQKARIVAAARDTVGASVDSTDNVAAGNTQFGNDGRPKAYRQAAVVYANGKDAYLLRPSSQPSACYGRKPYADYIRKGRSIGIHVVRGFDDAQWDRLHPPPGSTTARKAYAGISAPSWGPSSAAQDSSEPAPGSSQNPHVTDLVFVVHGIGQKLSERVESYNFTYAMNDFRREFNVQLGSNTVKPHLRGQMGSIMVLPVNWRSTLSFEEGGYRDDTSDTSYNEYTLQDITPESLPNVRNIVSDVMLDIPYYLSHHQPRMIQAVIDEANRIYSLWCKNNPGFDRWGRVHIIAHSLGSVMAIDILSKQPTRTELPPADQRQEQQGHFLFNTANLFLCGSPAGFFLLLRKAGLRPRAAREKLMSNATDTDYGVGEEAGQYGCIAVDNVYNILNPYDPVSYRLNAAVDTVYAASLKQAVIPSAANSWFSFRGSARSGYSKIGVNGKNERPDMTQRFPSNVELETHNFTREEIAEKRAYLLNDNGQIDFFLRYGGGPLEIQYLTMLGAHSSYWTSKDFIRFLVIEVGREPGRENALDALKAHKKKVVPLPQQK